MRLDQHRDFADIVTAAADDLRRNGQPKIRDEHVEKDYWVTAVLRRSHEYLGERALFKGGTSLSKGWGIIRRFSEDVDLAVYTLRDAKQMSKGQIRDDLSKLARFVGDQEGLERQDHRKRVSDGARDEYYSFERRVEGFLPASIKLEVGTRSGQIPNVHRPIRSDVAKYVQSQNLDLGETVVESAFSMRLMDRRRTFTEKLFAIHSEVERHLAGNRELGTSIRHYYDLHALAQTEDVQEFLGTEEHQQVRQNYAEICAEHFPSAILPSEMCLRESRALFPTDDLVDDLREMYESQIQLLSFEESPPTFAQVLAQLEGLRERI